MVGPGPGATASSQIDVAAPARTGDGRASRSGGNCGRTGPGQARVERYLATQTARFGQVSMDAKQDAVDCAAIKKFQTAVALPTATGFADDATAEIADRLYNSTPASCEADADATTVCVDLSHQTLWVMRDGSVVFAPVVIRTSGAKLATPTGQFEITEKEPTLSGAELPYWQRFFEDFGLHATDTSFYTEPDSDSRGVNLLSGDAKTVYGLTEIGSEVHVFGHKAGT
ncbi:L,D-transpeptidase [Cryptosporangium minutisporangium]